MKRKEIRNCDHCGKGLCKQNPLFYKIAVTPFIVNTKALQQIGGLEQFFGGGTHGAVLANIMGPDPDIAKEVHDATELLICTNCMMNKLPILAYTVESRNEALEKKEINQSN